jgi:hypothetical protein
MKKLYNKLMIALSKRPYKTIRLESGLMIDYFKNGKMYAGDIANDGRIIKETIYHG